MFQGNSMLVLVNVSSGVFSWVSMLIKIPLQDWLESRLRISIMSYESVFGPCYIAIERPLTCWNFPPQSLFSLTKIHLMLITLSSPNDVTFPLNPPMWLTRKVTSSRKLSFYFYKLIKIKLMIRCRMKSYQSQFSGQNRHWLTYPAFFQSILCSDLMYTHPDKIKLLTIVTPQKNNKIWIMN